MSKQHGKKHREDPRKESEKYIPEMHQPEFEEPSRNEYSHEKEELKSKAEYLGINIKKQTESGSRREVEKIFSKINEGDILSDEDLEGKGYKRMDPVAFKEGFDVKDVLDEDGNLKWSDNCLPMFVYNCLNKDVVIGKHPSGKFAVYIKEK